MGYLAIDGQNENHCEKNCTLYYRVCPVDTLIHERFVSQMFCPSLQIKTLFSKAM